MIVVFLVLGSIVTALLYVLLLEYKDWNNGVSKMTNSKWELFTTDSSGSRGYKDSEGNVIWISWIK